jgi:hypothetical protein
MLSIHCRIRPVSPHRLTFTVMAVLALAGCRADVQAPADGDIVFLTQSVVPNAVMDALFNGSVLIDGNGCIRGESPDNLTIIWPNGFTLDRHGDAARIRDTTGRDVGGIPGPFRLGGGIAQTLHEGIALTDADRKRALERCPGQYWIAGDVPGTDG